MNQQRTLLRLLAALQPHWRRDPALPARIQSLFARHKEFGSRDRRLYREMIYTTLRYLPWIEPLLTGAPEEAVRRIAWFAAELPATANFRAASATGEPPTGNRAELLPTWFQAHCPAIFERAELDAQLRRAPLWLRLQTSTPDGVTTEFESRGWKWRRAEALSNAIEIVGDVDVTRTDAWTDGLFEVQDLGSQMILESVGIGSGEHWLDACAGAGGKTLQLAALLGSAGRIAAFDVRPAALEELAARARRAGIPLGTGAGESSAATIDVLTQPPTGNYDGVLVDAPCSGSGTWRRSPHLKWVTTEAQILRASEMQQTLLSDFSARVRPGGRLVYATCSLSARENEDVIESFLASHRDFEPAGFGRDFGFKPHGVGLTILPARHDTDGFFVASLRRRR
jgi:16S rRNA (cytosine967-C5)-methyltransferase